MVSPRAENSMNVLRRCKQALRSWKGLFMLAVAAAATAGVICVFTVPGVGLHGQQAKSRFRPHSVLDSSGNSLAIRYLPPWPPYAPLEAIASAWKGVGHKGIALLDRMLNDSDLPADKR